MFNKAISRVKNFLGKSYVHGKNILGRFDDAYTTGKKIYSAVAPMIESMAPQTKALTNNVMKGLNAYENLRSKVMDSHETISNNINNVVGGLKKSGIKLSLP